RAAVAEQVHSLNRCLARQGIVVAMATAPCQAERSAIDEYVVASIAQNEEATLWKGDRARDRVALSRKTVQRLKPQSPGDLLTRAAGFVDKICIRGCKSDQTDQVAMIVDVLPAKGKDTCIIRVAP